MTYNLGQSVIWETTPRFNVMMETFFLSAQKVVGSGKTEWSNTLFLNPGIRWAYNFNNGLQSFLASQCPSASALPRERRVSLYLSFEHPFRKIPDQ